MNAVLLMWVIFWSGVAVYCAFRVFGALHDRGWFR